VTAVWAVVLVVGLLWVLVWLIRPASPAANEPLTPEMVRALLETLMLRGLMAVNCALWHEDANLSYVS
jgi:hypothetical protein